MYDKTERLQILVNNETKNFIRCIHPDRGFLTNTINAFLNAILNDCKLLGVNHYSPENLVKLNDIIRLRTAPRTSGDESKRHEPRPTQRIRDAYENLKNKSSSVQQTAPVRGKGASRRRDSSEEKEIN